MVRFWSPMRTTNGKAAVLSPAPPALGLKLKSVGLPAIAKAGTWKMSLTALPPNTCMGVEGWKLRSTGRLEKGSRSLTCRSTIGV